MYFLILGSVNNLATRYLYLQRDDVAAENT
jgi:hypothetical protein